MSSIDSHKSPENAATAPSGRTYWRSLDELADTPEFRRFVEHEFPGFTQELFSSTSRRHFLKVMGASFGLAGMGGLSGCIRWPEEKIVPFAYRPAGLVPGQPGHYATCLELGAGTVHPVLATSYDGRPIKIEGNPQHPASLGAATSHAQASVLDLYDPDRSRELRHRAGEGDATPLAKGWNDPNFQQVVTELRASGGEGVAVLAETSTSPSLQALRARLPKLRWIEYEPVSWDNERDGLQVALGGSFRVQLALERAKVVVSLDSDFLMRHPLAVRLARDFSRQRRATDGTMNRLHVFEANLTVTGGSADHRVPVTAGMLPAVAGRLASELRRQGLELSELDEALRPFAEAAGEHQAAIARAARDLLAHRGQGVLVVGPGQPALVHALAAAINHALGNAGSERPVAYSELPAADSARPSHGTALTQFQEVLSGGAIHTVLILGGNPVYNAPADVDLRAVLAGVRRTIHLGYHYDETARACEWHLPRAHALESWGDARTHDGTYTLQQPLILPMTYEGHEARTPSELLSFLFEATPRTGHEIVQATFEGLHGGGESAWKRALQDGFVANTRAATRAPAPRTPWAQPAALAMLLPGAPAGNCDLVFVSDYSLLDGRFANNGWLQELPDPITKVVWDNAALMGPATAEQLKVRAGQMLTLAVEGRTLELAAYLVPGLATGTVVLPLGYGRRDPFQRPAGFVSYNARSVESLRVAAGVGFDTYRLRAGADFTRAAVRAEVRPGLGEYLIASTQDHHAIGIAPDHPSEKQTLTAREQQRRQKELLVRGTLAEYREHGDGFVAHAMGLHGHHGADAHGHEHEHDHGHDPDSGAGTRETVPHNTGHGKSLWKEYVYEGHRWGMGIDLSVCTGCSACVIACQAENNIAVVGKDEVHRGREMHWIRVDRYFHGSPTEPQVLHQPLTCQQCENAPCESVCPVGATMHSEEGLNDMVYNRCIGTRYCSNNCPYKVRRFNYFNNHKVVSQTEQLVYNPEVTVRHRGVMEKCTFCVQRIQNAKIEAKNAGRALRDGDIVSACQQTCPTEAIVFGDLSDPNSKVSQMHALKSRSYTLFEYLNVKPRNRYLAKLTNPMEG